MTPRQQQIILLMRLLHDLKHYKGDACHFTLAVCQKYGYKPATVKTALEWLQEHHIIRAKRGVVV